MIIIDNKVPTIVDKFLQDLKKHLDESGQSGLSLAKEAGISQSQISAWYHGKIVRYGANAKKVHNVINNYQKTNTSKLPDKISLSILKVWDGTEENADQIVKFIESLEPLINSKMKTEGLDTSE